MNTNTNDRSLLVSLDGGVTYQPALNGVRVIYNEMPNPDDEEGSTELHVNLTGEGVIMDVYDGDDLLGSNSEMASDIVMMLANS